MEAGLKRAEADDDALRRRTALLVKLFHAPEASFGGLDSETVAALIAAASDIVLVMDRQGVIRDVSFSGADLHAQWGSAWVGRRWADVVTIESRPKVEALLKEASSTASFRGRHVNHPSPLGADVPILYSALRMDEDGRVAAMGRDLRAAAALQQRLVDAQQSMERDYARLRSLETRHRLLFDVTSEAALIVDAGNGKVLEANAASAQWLGRVPKRIVGRPLVEGLSPQSATALQELLSNVRATGRPDGVRARTIEAERQFFISAALFRQENAPYFLIRLLPVEAEAAAEAAPNAKLLALLERAPDGFVATGADGRILSANAAFLDLAQLASEEQARGESLDRWLGRPGVDLNVLIANLRQHGSVRLFATTLRNEYGVEAEIEVSATSAPNGDQPCFGFLIRNVGRRPAADKRPGRDLPRSVEQMAELVGRVPLKDLVRETTHVIERLCIEAALELTGDNRASAAEILGLSRQSLYMKLRRYGIREFDADADG